MTDSVVDDGQGGGRSRTVKGGTVQWWRRGAFRSGVGFVLALAAGLAAVHLVNYVESFLTRPEMGVLEGLTNAPVSVGEALGSTIVPFALLLGGWIGIRHAGREVRPARRAALGVALTVSSVGTTSLCVGYLGDLSRGGSLELEWIPWIVGMGIAGGVVVLGAAVVTGRTLGRPPSDPLARVRTRFSPTAFGVGLVAGGAVLGGLQMLTRNVTEYAVGLQETLLAFSSLVGDWSNIYVPGTSSALVVGIVAGVAWSRKDRFRAALAVGGTYLVLAGTLAFVAGRLSPAYGALGAVYRQGVYNILSYAVGLAVATAVVADIVGKWYPTDTGRQGTVPRRPGGRGSHRPRGLTAGRKLALFCGLLAVAALGALIGSGVDYSSVTLYGSFDAIPYQFANSALEIAVVAGVVYALADDGTTPLGAATTSFVGVTAGYLVVALAWIAAYGVVSPEFAVDLLHAAEVIADGGFPDPTEAGSIAKVDALADAEEALEGAIDLFGPAVAVGGVAAVSAALTGRVVGGRSGQ